MNVLTRTPAATQQIAWWENRNMIALVRNTAFKDCNATEFDQAVAVARELNLSPLRKQIYAFVMGKGKPRGNKPADDSKRSLVMVVSIDGARSIAARHQNYRADNEAPRYTYDETLKNPHTNPLGLVSAEVAGFQYSHGEWHKIVGVVYWDEFAPVVTAFADSDCDMVDTGETWPDGNAKKKRVPRQGAVAVSQLDPKKDGWRKMARLMLAKCAEMMMLRKGWPEDLSSVYAPEEIDRASTLEDVDYIDMTPSQAADAAEADKRLARIGGADQIAASFDASNDIVYVPVGQFADRVLAATAKMAPAEVVQWTERNKEALRYFWGKAATDALELKKVLESRSAGAVAEKPAASPPVGKTAPADNAAPQHTPTAGAVTSSKDELLDGVAAIMNKREALAWSQTNKDAVAKLPVKDRQEVMGAFYDKKDAVPA